MIKNFLFSFLLQNIINIQVYVYIVNKYIYMLILITVNL